MTLNTTLVTNHIFNSMYPDKQIRYSHIEQLIKDEFNVKDVSSSYLSKLLKNLIDKQELEIIIKKDEYPGRYYQLTRNKKDKLEINLEENLEIFLLFFYIDSIENLHKEHELSESGFIKFLSKNNISLNYLKIEKMEVKPMISQYSEYTFYKRILCFRIWKVEFFNRNPHEKIGLHYSYKKIGFSVEEIIKEKEQGKGSLQYPSFEKVRLNEAIDKAYKKRLLLIVGTYEGSLRYEVIPDLYTFLVNTFSLLKDILRWTELNMKYINFTNTITKGRELLELFFGDKNLNSIIIENHNFYQSFKKKENRNAELKKVNEEIKTIESFIIFQVEEIKNNCQIIIEKYNYLLNKLIRISIDSNIVREIKGKEKKQIKKKIPI